MSLTSAILVTGGTQGMGYYTTLALARHYPSNPIIIASRTDPASTAAKINTTLQQLNVKYMPLDLGSLAAVRDFVQRWKRDVRVPIRALVLNAAIQFPKGNIRYSADGMEASFAVNHVGHALLVLLLLGEMEREGRIVVVSSGVHDPDEGWGIRPNYTTPSEVAAPSPASLMNSSGSSRYATSKVANVLWALALARHLRASPLHVSKSVFVLDPGLMPGTGLMRNASVPFKWLLMYVGPYLIGLLRLVMHPNIQTPKDSGESLAWLAVGEELKGRSGEYFEQRRSREVSN